MREKDLSDLVVALTIFIISASDFYKGFLLAFTEKVPLLFMAQIGFGILKFLPSPIKEQRSQGAMIAYTKRGKWNGVYALVGGLLGCFWQSLFSLRLKLPWHSALPFSVRLIS